MNNYYACLAPLPLPLGRPLPRPVPPPRVVVDATDGALGCSSAITDAATLIPATDSAPSPTVCKVKIEL